MERKNVTQRKSLIFLTISLFAGSSQVGWAANSDSLEVNYGGVQGKLTAAEPAKEGDPEDVLDTSKLAPGGARFNPVLPKTGYMVFDEAGTGDKISDILVSYTGSSLMLFSDGSLGFPTIAALHAAGLAQLGLARFESSDKEVSYMVGTEFGVAENAIKVTLDADPVPDSSSTLWLLVMALLAAVTLRMTIACDFGRRAYGTVNVSPNF